MSDFDQILEDCLNDLASGASDLEGCLARHPEYAAQLRPLLSTAARVGMGGEVEPPAAFKARARARLTLHMQAQPRKRGRSGSTFRRLLPILAALILALLVTGTVYAQGALPGDAFYGWKLATERVWRMVSSDHVRTDLQIANRRIGEINVVIDDPARRARALEGYYEVKTRLEDDFDAETLESLLPPLDQFDYPEQVTPTVTPTLDGATQHPEDPEIISTKAPGEPPTKLPKIVPTIKIPPPIR